MFQKEKKDRQIDQSIDCGRLLRSFEPSIPIDLDWSECVVRVEWAHEWAAENTTCNRRLKSRGAAVRRPTTPTDLARRWAFLFHSGGPSQGAAWIGLVSVGSVPTRMPDFAFFDALGSAADWVDGSAQQAQLPLLISESCMGSSGRCCLYPGIHKPRSISPFLQGASGSHEPVTPLECRLAGSM